MGSVLSIFEGFEEPLFELFVYIGSGFVADVCNPVRMKFKEKFRNAGPILTHKQRNGR